MKGTPPLTLQRQSALPASQWSAGLGGSLRGAKVLLRSTEPGIQWEIRSTPSCVWVILKMSKSFSLGIRAVSCPTGLDKVKLGSLTKTAVEFTVAGALGKFHVRGTFIEGLPPMLRLMTRLTPAEDVRITAAPRDLAVFESKLEPYHGMGVFSPARPEIPPRRAFSALWRRRGPLSSTFRT